MTDATSHRAHREQQTDTPRTAAPNEREPARASTHDSAARPGAGPLGPAPHAAHISARDAAFAAYAWGPGGF